MARNRASAKAAGTRMETLVATYLRDRLNNDAIDRQTKTGAKDLGDIRGVKLGPHKVAVEVKDVTKQALPQWLREAEVERQNLGALIGVVVSKRHGTTNPGSQYVHMTLETFATILQAASLPPRPVLGIDTLPESIQAHIRSQNDILRALAPYDGPVIEGGPWTWLVP